MRRLPRHKPTNLARRREQGERFLRMAGVASLAEAEVVLQDPTAPVQRRCLSILAIGLLEDEAERVWNLIQTVTHKDRSLRRACRRADSWAYDVDSARLNDEYRQRTHQKWETLGVSHANALAILQDQSASVESRSAAAEILGQVRSWESISALLDVLEQGEELLPWACSHALIAIRSKRHMRRLLAILRRSTSLNVKKAAIYTIWCVGEQRAAETLIFVGANLKGEQEGTRSMAVEALGNTVKQHRSQKALAKHLFDPSVDVRYSALCALSRLQPPLPEFLQAALRAKLDDPAKLDEERVVATLARQILTRSWE